MYQQQPQDENGSGKAQHMDNHKYHCEGLHENIPPT